MGRLNMEYVESHGAKIPAIGLGMMTLKDAVCVEAVQTALKLGYTHLDTAERYGNEAAVGEGLAASGMRRDDVFVTTKVYWEQLAAADFARGVDESLKKLRLSSVDLLLIHWNNPKVPLKESIGALCKAKRDGLTRHIGVANFPTALLDEAVSVASEPLVANQIEVHPYLDQAKVVAACRRHGISVTAYCPAARGKILGDPLLERIGAQHGKSVTQIALRWLIQQGMVPIPRTANPAHLKANLEIFDFTLTDAQMKEISGLARPDGRVVNPPHSPVWDA
jgi:2,5-diketo-D-gluconate reductase B